MEAQYLRWTPARDPLVSYLPYRRNEPDITSVISITWLCQVGLGGRGGEEMMSPSASRLPRWHSANAKVTIAKEGGRGGRGRGERAMEFGELRRRVSRFPLIVNISSSSGKEREDSDHVSFSL